MRQFSKLHAVQLFYFTFIYRYYHLRRYFLFSTVDRAVLFYVEVSVGVNYYVLCTPYRYL